MKEKGNNRMMSTYLILFICFLCLGIFIHKLINSPEKVNLSSYELKLVDYFNEVALNSEFGKSPKRVIKWDSKMFLYISKDKTYKKQVDKINEVVNNINSIVNDSSFEIEITENKLESNAIIFLGNIESMKKYDPLFFEGIDMNLTGLVDIEYENDNFTITRSKIFINTDEPLDVQLSTILEEVTQSIGIPADSNSYSNSIFYANQIDEGNIITKYSKLDVDIIKLLYHPKILPGLNNFQVNHVFKRILKSDPNYFGEN